MVFAPDGESVRDVGVGHEQVAVADAGQPAAARRAAMDLNSRITFRSPRRLAAELQVLRHEPDGGHREDFIAVANLGDAVHDARGADSGKSRPMRTRSPMVTYGPTTCRSRPRRARTHDCGGRTSAAGVQAHHELGFRGDLVVDVFLAFTRASALAARADVTSASRQSAACTCRWTFTLLDLASATPGSVSSFCLFTRRMVATWASVSIILPARPEIFWKKSSLTVTFLTALIPVRAHAP